MFGPDPNWFMSLVMPYIPMVVVAFATRERLDTPAQTDGAGTHRTTEETVDFLTGLTNFTNWSGNVIMPTLAGIFFVIAILRAARSAPFQYAMYAGLMSLMVSGILRGIETFSRVRAWNDPDQVWVTLLGLVNWSANVFLACLWGRSRSSWPFFTMVALDLGSIPALRGRGTS